MISIFVLIFRYASESVNRMLIGNKCDMSERREVSYDEGLELCIIFNNLF